MSLALQQRQARDLVRLREVRMRSAAAALADARAATARAEAARTSADLEDKTAEHRQTGEVEQLAEDPGEAERRLALVDQARFKRAMAGEALNAAREAERVCERKEAERRKAMIVARARHDILAERADAIARRIEQRNEERAAMDAEDIRRFR